MPTPEWIAEQFEEHRAHVRAVAYRMLGSASEAEDAVQESWIRLGRTDVSAVEWLLEALEPAERLAFVLHDVFGMTFDGIAPIRGTLAGRSASARKPWASARSGERP